MSKSMTTSDLLRLSQKADEGEFNRRLDTDVLRQQLDPNATHTTAFALPHDDAAQIRAEVLMRWAGIEEPVVGLLDMTIEDYTALRNVQQAPKGQRQSGGGKGGGGGAASSR